MFSSGSQRLGPMLSALLAIRVGEPFFSRKTKRAETRK